jgi:hypothetical protein
MMLKNLSRFSRPLASGRQMSTSELPSSDKVYTMNGDMNRDLINSVSAGEGQPQFGDHHSMAAALKDMRDRRFQTSTDRVAMENLIESQAKRELYDSLSQADGSDHAEIKYIKSKIAKMVQHELQEHGFKEQLSEEESAALTESIATSKSFYFKTNENKKHENTKVHNFKAPGNHHRHPSIVVPHEGVHIQNYIETSSLNEEKLTEIYAYYQHLIDLHIS